MSSRVISFSLEGKSSAFERLAVCCAVCAWHGNSSRAGENRVGFSWPNYLLEGFASGPSQSLSSSNHRRSPVATSILWVCGNRTFSFEKQGPSYAIFASSPANSGRCSWTSPSFHAHNGLSGHFHAILVRVQGHVTTSARWTPKKGPRWPAEIRGYRRRLQKPQTQQSLVRSRRPLWSSIARSTWSVDATTEAIRRLLTMRQPWKSLFFGCHPQGPGALRSAWEGHHLVAAENERRGSSLRGAHIHRQLEQAEHPQRGAHSTARRRPCFTRLRTAQPSNEPKWEKGFRVSSVNIALELLQLGQVGQAAVLQHKDRNRPPSDGPQSFLFDSELQQYNPGCRQRTETTRQ